MLSPSAAALRGIENLINPYLWCAIGAAIGFLAGAMAGQSTRITRIEEILVGIFGAFIGGEFVAAQFRAPDATGFSIGAAALAVGGAVLMLFLLQVVRRAAGPLRPHKSRGAGRR